MKKFLLPLFLGSFLNVSSQTFSAGTPYSLYTDINPDTLLNYTLVPYTHETYDINMFGDAAADLQFVASGAVSSGGSAAYIDITSLNPNVFISVGRLDSVYVTSSSSWNVTKVGKVLGTGDQINTASAVWDNGTVYLTDHSGSGGGNKNVNDWVGGDKYIGLKYMNGSSLFYGWIRVQCPNQDSCYVKDFSAAPAAVGIPERTKNAALIYPNPVNDNFYLKNIDAVSINVALLKLKDIYGNEVGFTCETTGKDLKIDLDNSLPAGCYIVEYISNDRSFSKKLIKTGK